MEKFCIELFELCIITLSPVPASFGLEDMAHIAEGLNDLLGHSLTDILLGDTNTQPSAVQPHILVGLQLGAGGVQRVSPQQDVEVCGQVGHAAAYQPRHIQAVHYGAQWFPYLL